MIPICRRPILVSMQTRDRTPTTRATSQCVSSTRAPRPPSFSRYVCSQAHCSLRHRLSGSLSPCPIPIPARCDGTDGILCMQINPWGPSERAKGASKSAKCFPCAACSVQRADRARGICWEAGASRRAHWRLVERKHAAKKEREGTGDGGSCKCWCAACRNLHFLYMLVKVAGLHASSSRVSSEALYSRSTAHGITTATHTSKIACACCSNAGWRESSTPKRRSSHAR
jgi:hypothetical protein